jgi:hypothetical protein
MKGAKANGFRLIPVFYQMSGSFLIAASTYAYRLFLRLELGDQTWQNIKGESFHSTWPPPAEEIP